MRNSRHNNALIPSGEARLVGWSRSMLYSGFNTLPRSVVRLADSGVRWDNADVIQLKKMIRFDLERFVISGRIDPFSFESVSYTHLRAHETDS